LFQNFCFISSFHRKRWFCLCWPLFLTPGFSNEFCSFLLQMKELKLKVAWNRAVYTYTIHKFLIHVTVWSASCCMQPVLPNLFNEFVSGIITQLWHMWIIIHIYRVCRKTSAVTDVGHALTDYSWIYSCTACIISMI
jgi:hypothetical protein